MDIKKTVVMLLPIITASLPQIFDEAGKVIETFISHNVMLSFYVSCGLWFVFHALPSSVQHIVTGDQIPTAPVK